MGPLLGFRSAAALDGHILSRVVFVPLLASLLQYWLQRPPVLKAKREDLTVESTDHRDVLGVHRSGQGWALAWVSELPRKQHQFHRVIMTTKGHLGHQVRGHTSQCHSSASPSSAPDLSDAPSHWPWQYCFLRESLVGLDISGLQNNAPRGDAISLWTVPAQASCSCI